MATSSNRSKISSQIIRRISHGAIRVLHNGVRAHSTEIKRPHHRSALLLAVPSWRHIFLACGIPIQWERKEGTTSRGKYRRYKTACSGKPSKGAREDREMNVRISSSYLLFAPSDHIIIVPLPPA